eukprot:748678-Prorocentrum_minimum.AAC.2
MSRGQEDCYARTLRWRSRVWILFRWAATAASTAALRRSSSESPRPVAEGMLSADSKSSVYATDPEPFMMSVITDPLPLLGVDSGIASSGMSSAKETFACWRRG